jgi:hypothetical protein
MAAKQAFPKSGCVFGQARKAAKMLRAGLDTRISTNDQQPYKFALYYDT